MLCCFFSDFLAGVVVLAVVDFFAVFGHLPPFDAADDDDDDEFDLQNDDADDEPEAVVAAAAAAVFAVDFLLHFVSQTRFKGVLEQDNERVEAADTEDIC